MNAFSRIILLLAAVQMCLAYTSYQQPEYSSGYSSSSHYTSSSSSSSSSGDSASVMSCCELNQWGREHMDEVRQFANKLRLAYNDMSRGSSSSRAFTGLNWNENVLSLTGRSAMELDELNRQMGEELVRDMRAGVVPYSTILQPRFFQWKAAETLYSLAQEGHNDFGQQQQQMELPFEPFEPSDLSKFDEVKNYNYPAEVKVIDGKTYVVHKNYTEAHKTSGDGTFDSPLVTVRASNRTTITTNSMPGTYSPSMYSGTSSGSMMGGRNMVSYPMTSGTSTTRVSQKKTIYDWMNQHMEPSVMDYSPVVSVGSDYNSNMHSYQPTVHHIPVDTGSMSEVETFNTGSHVYRPSYAPGSTVTIRRYNKTIITNPDGTNTVRGAETNKKWVNGVLVYDTERPFGEWSVPRDEEWKREERERFFWFLNQGTITPQRLEMWQRQQEERLLALADRYHTSIEEIYDWHRKELERYRVLLGQYQAQSNDLTGWKRMERGRLDWLIHQNSVTREELERWQRENQDKLAELARQYRISLEELKNWQIEELNRLYVYFNDQNNSMLSNAMNSDSLRRTEQERLEELIRQHNETILQLQNSIKGDQQRLKELSQTYHGNVKDMEKWLKEELARLGGIIKDQQNEMTRITTWQRSERDRIENIVRQHRGSIEELEAKMAHDRNYIQNLASKYHISIEELERWQREELNRLQKEGQMHLETDIKAWLANEHKQLEQIIKQNGLTVEEFEARVMNDRSRLEDLAKTYKIQVSEVEEWIRNEIKNFQTEGLIKEVQKELAIWQQKERDRLNAIVRQNEITVEELEKKIKEDQSHLYKMANTYQVGVEEIEEWLKKEILRLQSQGLVKPEDLQDWQRQERDQIMKIVQQNKLTIEEFEKKLLEDRQRLQELSRLYNVKTTEIESWIKQEGERLQNLGLLQMQEQLNNWQKIERERLLMLINKNNLSIGELQEKIEKDKSHLVALANQHHVRVEEIEEWIKKEIQRLHDQGLIEMEKLRDWQTEWRGNLTNMVKERDFTVEEFHKWLMEDRQRLNALAMQHNVQIEEIEQWVRNEEQRFVSMGLLKPYEKLTNWQEIERRYLERITQEQYHSTEQLEQRLRQDRELLEQLARQYSVQVEEVENWMKKELARLRDDGQLQIDNLTAWQIAERERLEVLHKQNKNWSVEEFEAELRKDREHLQKMAFQYHTSVEEVEKWIESEVGRMRQQGKLTIQNLTDWQKAERDRILTLLRQQQSITVEEFERKVQQDRRFLMNLANQYHVSALEVEDYVKKVIDELRKKGEFEVRNLQTWQVVERDYIKQLIEQYNNGLSTSEYEQKLLADRAHLRQLADQYRISIDQIEKWMIDELKRLRSDSEQQVQQLAKWQVSEAQRLRDLVKKNSHLTYVEFEVELMKEHARLQDLATQYALSVEQIEEWLRQQLINLKTTGQVQVESLTKWQEEEQKRLIDLMLQQQRDISFEEFEAQLRRDRSRLQELSREYRVSVEQIENWMRDELHRLKNSGLLQVEELTQWQKMERDRLSNWLRQQQHNTTHEEFVEFLKRDEQRLQQIAQDYQVTVEEVESWVQQEGARLQLLGLIQRPEKYVWYSSNQNIDEMWKIHTRAHLQAIAQVRQMNWHDFERYLAEERMRWEQFARQYNITVEEIETWLREAAEDLVQKGLIEGTVTVEEWQMNEKAHIQNLINDKLRKQQKWSIEELERQLKYDQQHLQQLANQYHITVEEIEMFYKRELQRLLDQHKIVSENLIDWQRREKERLYRLVMREHNLSMEMLEERLLQDKNRLNNLADQYQISIEELEQWIRSELGRLYNLGLIQSTTSTTRNNEWQQRERQRLRTIAAEITITEEELLEFISGDMPYQQQLARMYGVSLEQLAPFQRIEINVMQREGRFDNRKLIKLEQWQKRERDRLYSLIKNQNFSMKNLRDWQRQDIFLNELAAKYGISVQTLKDWQISEYNRISRIAEHYRMSLNQLQDFRDKEIRYLAYVMHKMTSNEHERVAWGVSEAKRMQVLERKTGLSGEELLAWRRKLYLLAQGLIALDFGGYDGHEIGRGTTNRTAAPEQIISKDRGDQPPNVYEETVDNEEPGIAGQDPLYPPPSAELRVPPPVEEPPTSYIPPAAPTRAVQSGYRYTKKEYKFTVPVGQASAAATGGVNSASASAAVGIPPYPYMQDAAVNGNEGKFNGMAPHSLTRSIQEQQAEVDDFGQQQQQEELSWNGKLTEGQDQQQVEDFGQQQQIELDDYKQYDFGQQQQQQEVQVDDTVSSNFQSQYGASQKQRAVSDSSNAGSIDVTAEPESTGFWGKLKQKLG